jgi:PAS domain S-box-containing protein
MAEDKTGQNDSGNPSSGSGPTLRNKAEERLRKQSLAPGATSPEESARLLYELQVHQIELEMQNEELRRAQQELETSRAKYFDLYDLAPVGYLTLGDHGLILEANLTAAHMLGVDRRLLAEQPVTHFIAREDQDIYYLCRRKLLETGARQVCEVRMLRPEGGRFWVRLETTAGQGGESEDLGCRTVMSDITERKHAEESLRKAHDELEERIRDRTSELSGAVESLEAEISRRERVEETLRKSEAQVRRFASQCLMAHEEERKRIARELHDSIASCLAAIRFTLEKAQEEIKNGVASPPILQDAISSVTQATGEVRRIMVDLRPSVLDDLGVVVAIGWFCREFQQTYSHIRVEPKIELSEDEVPDSLKTVIFRIMQEAMNNIAKHSKATLVSLSLRKSDSKMELTIMDNGRGFDPDEAFGRKGAEGGLGLPGMRERAQLSGGGFSLESGDGAGTTIRAAWPLT